MATIVQDNNNSAQNSKESDSFIIEEYKTLRDEIKATKARLFLINSVGIGGIPVLLSWLSKIETTNNFALLLFELSVPFLVAAAIPLFLAENRNLMRCGRYIRKCIEPSLKNVNKYPYHIGWEKWLEMNNRNDLKVKNINSKFSVLNKVINKFNNQIIFDKRSVDKFLFASFILIFLAYYLSSSILSIDALHQYSKESKKYPLLFGTAYCLFFIYIVLYIYKNYHDLISTKHHDPIDVLTFDIGGTNTRIEIFHVYEDDPKESNDYKNINTNDFVSFEKLLCIADINNKKYSKIVIAVPGAVTSNCNNVYLPYVRWEEDFSEQDQCSIIKQNLIEEKYPNIIFINDFIAQAYGCLVKEVTKNAISLYDGVGKHGSDIAIIGAGTGTGHCALKKTSDDSYICIPSEAGHILFPFLYQDEEENEFRIFLSEKKNISRPVCNDVVSGRGLSRLHQFITKQEKELPANEVVKEIKADSATTQYFAKFYGRVCRNYAIATLAAGGTLYVSGGVAMKNDWLVKNKYFEKEFLQSETTVREILKNISVKLIKNDRIGLFGAAYYGAYIHD